MTCFDVNKYMRLGSNLAIIKPDVIRNDGTVRESQEQPIAFSWDDIAKLMYSMAVVKP